MKRVPRLVELSRREFCAFVGLASAAGVTVACGGSDAPATTDAASGGGTCGTGAIDVGAASAFTAGTPMYFSNGNFFVVRDAGGLYALTAKCTHAGTTVRVSGTQFRCPSHGATFTFDGAVTSGPASSPLVHYELCTLASGNIGVTTTKTVPASTRLAV